MQPFDALTMRAVLQELRPLLLNRRIEKIYQLGRDEIILAFRLKTGPAHLLLSAHTSYGRICLVKTPNLPKSVNPPTFCQLLRKHLAGASLLELKQGAGERIIDLVFNCVDELGSRSTKILTAEIMGRHSNLIFWEQDSEKILGASHVVTAEMSRHREVAAGLRYVRPPQQDKPNIFLINNEVFDAAFGKLNQTGSSEQKSEERTEPKFEPRFEQWILATFAGMGRHLSEEVIAATGINSQITGETLTPEVQQALWNKINALPAFTHYQPAMRHDLSRHSVLSWWPELQAGGSGKTEWELFPSANDMVDRYFQSLQQREQLKQLRERINSELKSETDRLSARLEAANKQLNSTEQVEQLKIFGDLILSNIQAIDPGQSELACQNLYNAENSADAVRIPLNPNLTPSQNAQNYYRQFAKSRVRQRAASVTKGDITEKLAMLQQHMANLEQAKSPEELTRLKEIVLDRGKRQDQQKIQQPAKVQNKQTPAIKSSRLTSTKSSDGWLIYVGRNKNENDVLVSKLAQPQDIWLHVQGQEGAHVLIKNPNKQDPPGSTIREAAQLAARFSRISLGSKVRVVYTYCKFVKKTGKDKPGLVRYENEKTIEVDTSAPMPASLRSLFAR